MQKLTLYHGSRDGLIGDIRPDQSRASCDFGQGFYMGVDVHQPRTLICGREAKRPTMYTLELDLSDLRLLRFTSEIDWALFVAFNRNRMSAYGTQRFYNRYREMRAEADVIFGKIADDRIFQTVSQFFDGQITAPCLVEALKALNLGDQYCAVTAKACAAIRLVDEHALGSGEIEKYHQFALRQHELAVKRTAEIIHKWRRNTGFFYDEILERLAKEDRAEPTAEDARGEVRS